MAISIVMVTWKGNVYDALSLHKDVQATKTAEREGISSLRDDHPKWLSNTKKSGPQTTDKQTTITELVSFIYMLVHICHNNKEKEAFHFNVDRMKKGLEGET